VHLPTTDTELNDIASAAMSGDSRIPKNGYSTPAGDRNAQRVVDQGEGEILIHVPHRRLRDLSSRAMPRKSPFTSVIWALFIATSVPVPMAIPTFARANAGASLMPSPAIATRVLALQPCDQSALSCGRNLTVNLIDVLADRLQPSLW
jgi:hypothetical protein